MGKKLQEDIAEYRRQAELARHHAEHARSQETKDGFIKMAIEWDKLADAAGKAWD